MVSHVTIPLRSAVCCIYNTVTMKGFNNDHDTNAACVTHSKQNYTAIVSVNTSNCNLDIKMMFTRNESHAHTPSDLMIRKC